MILEIDFNSDEAIYVQLRNQIIWELHVQNLLMENHFHLSGS